jgi:hypothetical protein
MSGREWAKTKKNILVSICLVLPIVLICSVDFFLIKINEYLAGRLSLNVLQTFNQMLMVLF